MRPHLWFIRFIGLIVPRRLRLDWRQEWEAELRYREYLLADWDRLDWRHKVDLLWRSTSAFWDALWLQPKRLEDEMFQDLRYGVRMLLKNPSFTAVVVLTLALCIGANAALFSVVNGVLLSPLPYPHPEQLVTLHQSKPNFETGAIPYPNFRDWQKENRTFSSMAITRWFGFTLIGVGEAERVSGRLVTADLFSVLGVTPALGRTFEPGEDEAGKEPVVVMSAGLWQRKFSSDPDVIGKGMTLDDKSYTIIGVLPEITSIFGKADVFVPIGQWNGPALQSRSAALGLHGIGRLKPGVALDQGQADLNVIMANLAEAYPATNKGQGAKLVSLNERIVGDIGTTLLMLLGAVGFVLLIACVNVSNLLLARSTGRTREFAIRSALGAGQWRLLRQSLTESLLLSLAGGGLGLAVAAWGTGIALRSLPTTVPRAEEVGLDGRVVLFTVAISLFTGILAGLAPALKSSDWHLSEVLKEAGRGVIGGRVRAQGILVAVEMALALVLLIGAGLMVRSLNALWKVDPGFRSDNLLTFGVNLSPSFRNASPEASRATMRELSDQIASTPGVRAASLSWGASPMQSEDDLFFWLDSQPKPASQSEMNMALVYTVEPNYLTAMGIPLKRGRFFNDQDNEKAPRVVVIDELLGRKYFGDQDPLGKKIHIDNNGGWQIVGVVGHVEQWGLSAADQQELQSQLYFPFRALPDDEIGGATGAGVAVRLDERAPASLNAIRSVVQSLNSQNVLSGAQTMNQVITDSLATQRFTMILLNSFAAVALLLASIGIYGVISYLVGQRTHELGIRIALGAQRKDVMRLVLSHGMKMAVGGVALGLVAAVGLTRLMTSMLHGVSPTDPVTFGVIAFLLSGVALIACLVPARRATKVDPLVALRHE